MNIGDLKREIKDLPDNVEIKLGVNYDKCLHIQDLKEVYFFKSRLRNTLFLEG